MRRRLVLPLVSAALAVLGITALSVTAEQVTEPSDPAVDSQRHALLVGCTKYPMNKQIPPLTGPENDVRLFREVLKSRFGFADEDITELVGWPEDEARRPTLENITAAFERLIAKAAAGDQVVILMAGHGTQLPIPQDQDDPFDPENFEPDGRDEYFLPADTGRYSVQSGFPNAIRDNTFGDWLDRLRQRGASVWIIFDCCHAGTMTRSIADVEQDRFVSPSQLGVPDELFEEADQKVARAAAARDTDNGGRAPPVTAAAGDESWGGLVAFYSAQPYERAPEHPWPLGAARSRENVYGVFSYLLCQTLEQSEGTMTYRDLGRRIISRYRAKRGSRAPTPLFDGDLDRDLLGMDLGPRVPIYLEQRASGTRLSAGSLVGLTPGTVLAVYSPGGEGREEDEVHGYVRVTSVDPMYAEVESIAQGEGEAVPLVDLPDAARCRIIAQDLGDLRVSVALAGQEVSPPVYAKLQSAISALPPEVAALVRLVDSEAEADWVLQVVSPELAGEGLEVTVEKPEVFLLAGSGRQETLALETEASVPRVYGRYAAEGAADMAGGLSRDLRKIFAWRNVWRVAMTLEEDRSLVGGDIEFAVVSADAPAGAEGETGDPRGAEHILQPGQRIHLHLHNKGLYPYWVTLLYLDANYGISIALPARVLEAGERIGPMPVRITDSSFGSEGFVVMSVPLRAQRDRPDYSFLTQEPLGGDDRGWRAGPPQSPFAELMESVTAARPYGSRQAVFEEPTTPRTLSWTWQTVPNR